MLFEPSPFDDFALSVAEHVIRRELNAEGIEEHSTPCDLRELEREVRDGIGNAVGGHRSVSFVLGERLSRSDNLREPHYSRLRRHDAPPFARPRSQRGLGEPSDRFSITLARRAVCVNNCAQHYLAGWLVGAEFVLPGAAGGASAVFPPNTPRRHRITTKPIARTQPAKIRAICPFDSSIAFSRCEKVRQPRVVAACEG